MKFDPNIKVPTLVETRTLKFNPNVMVPTSVFTGTLEFDPNVSPHISSHRNPAI
jgi:hypothetical protein